MKIKFGIALFVFVLLAFKSSKIHIDYPSYFPKPIYDFFKNPLTNQKINLGRQLFYDPILSRDSTISCATCHSPYNAFTHVDHDLSHGIDGKIGKRNSPALMNLAWNKNFMWDGAIHHLDAQALAPISNPLEMDENILHVTQKLQQQPTYKKLYKMAYGDTLVTGERTLKALSQFMLTLVSAQAKYDSVQLGLTDFSAQEKNGFLLFQKKCNQCHTAPLFTNGEFENNGLPVDTTLNDWGRMQITKKSPDSLKFKVPTLRNIAYSYPYMHDGRFKTLSQVLKFYSSEVVTHPTLSPLLQKDLALSSNDRVDIIAFLLTLSDRNFIFNDKYSPPKKK